ncbi:MAG: response regulator [Isosphaeraceae bacterium]
MNDRSLNRIALIRFLARKGYQILEAEDGESALRIARERLPDLAIIDLFVKEIGGFEFAHTIRSEPGPLRELPILLVDAMAVWEPPLDLAHACGVSHIIWRFARPEEFIEAVEEVLRSPVEHESLRAWEEVATRLLRFQLETLVHHVRTVVRALAANDAREQLVDSVPGSTPSEDLRLRSAEVNGESSTAV